MRTAKIAKQDAEPDGERALQFVLVPNAAETRMPIELRRQRNALELKVKENHLGYKLRYELPPFDLDRSFSLASFRALCREADLAPEITSRASICHAPVASLRAGVHVPVNCPDGAFTFRA